MATIATIDFDSFAESATILPSAPWLVNGATAVASAAAATHGDRGARWISSATAGRIMYDTGANQTSSAVWSWYLIVRSHASVNHYIAGVYSLTTGGSIQADIRINPSTYTVTLRNAGSAVATSAESLLENTSYRFEWRVHSGNSQELRVYADDSTEPLFAISGAYTGAATRVFSVGPHVSATAGALDYDTVRLADDWVGPFVPSNGGTVSSLVDFNSLSDGQAITTASLGEEAWDVYTTTTQPEARGAAARHGVRGALISEATGPVIFNWNEARTTDTRVISFYFRLLTAPSALTYLAILRDGATNHADWRINADRTVTLRNNQIAVGGASSQTLAVNRWYRAEWMTSTSGQELRIYEGESATPYINQSGALSDNTHTRISCGVVGTPNGHSIQVDTLRVTESWAGSFGTPNGEPVINTHFYITPERGLRPFRLNRVASDDETPEPDEFPFWISHYDQQIRADYDPTFDGFEQALQDATGQSGPIGAFIHGYSGSNFPSTFQSSAVASAPLRGIGAMINVKRSDWQALANGDYDSTIQSFFNSWPVETFGSFTINHEPENDGPTPANPSNPSYASWASVQGPIWSQGIARTIAVAAPIIRARGLDVKLGGCLMDFSWDTTRWQYWDWWNYVDPQYLDVVEFQLDAYSKTVAGSPPQGYSLIPRLLECMSHARAANIQHFSLFETANDRRERNNGDNLVGTDESVAAFWESYLPALEAQIPETRMVSYFSIPTGPASGQAAIMGRGLEVFGTACLRGRRP